MEQHRQDPVREHADASASPEHPAARKPPPTQQTTLLDVFGGRRPALDATLPTMAFVLALVTAQRFDALDRFWGPLGAGVVTALAVAGWRATRGHQARAAVLGLVPVLGGAIIASRTGRIEDFFVLRIISNAASALVWTGSIWVGRPLLGVVVGSALRQRGAWRQDPHLYRAYSRASWWWAASFALRAAVLALLYFASATVLLGVVQIALSWPLFTLVLIVSWRVIQRALPPGHPGLRHPQTPA